MTVLTIRRAPFTVRPSPHHEGLLAGVASGGAISVMIESAVPANLRILSQGLPHLGSIDIVLYQRRSPNDPVVRDIAEVIRHHFTRNFADLITLDADMATLDSCVCRASSGEPTIGWEAS